MKKFNYTFIVASLLSLLLTGCMPDSLTKFKKDPPKKAASITSTAGDLIGSDGKVIDPDDIIYPTAFYYGASSGSFDKPVKLGENVSISPRTDGSLADPIAREAIFLKCELDTTGPLITRTLPPGLGLDKDNCVISGNPTIIYSDDTSGNEGNLIPYTILLKYRGANYDGTILSAESISARINIAAYQDLPDLKLTQNDKLVIELSGVSGNLISSIKTNTNQSDPYTSVPLSFPALDRKGVITTSTGVSAVVKYLNASASTIGVYRVTPIVIAAPDPLAPNVPSMSNFSTSGPTSFISVAGNTKTGKILSINSTTRTLYVETLTPTTTFAAGDAIDNAVSFSSSVATVSPIDNTYILDKTPAALDNDNQYFSNKYNIVKITQMYEVGVAIPAILPFTSEQMSTANGVTYSISPALPDGLIFSTTTGAISGIFSDIIDSTAFTVTATNPLGSKSATINIASIRSPQDLSFTQRQVIRTNSNGLFLQGEFLFQPIATPLTYSVKGRILRKISTDRLDIFAYNGTFLENAILDSGNAFYSEKSYIVNGALPLYYNLALKVTSSAGFTVGGYVTTDTIGLTPGAKARIVYIDSVSNTLYVQFLTPDPSNFTTFSEDQGVDNAYPFAAVQTFLTGIEADNMVLTTAAAHSFDKGDDMTTTTGNISGYVYSSTSSTIRVSDLNLNSANFLENFVTIVPGEFTTGGSSSVVSGTTHDNLIIIERGEPVTITANVSQGSSLIYNINPALPTGMTFDTATGIITGTPTLRLSSKLYVVTATNLLGSTSYAFNMEVRDYFSFAEISGAKSFLTHKIGDEHVHRACRINATDIINYSALNYSSLDIGCFIEAEELDLYYTKLKMSAGVGGGVCEYISFTPFAFWDYIPTPTSKTIDYAQGCTAPPPGSVFTVPNPLEECTSNYTLEGGPNCDEGSYELSTYTDDTTVPGTACNPVPVVTTVQCGGRATNCLAGPVTSVIRSDQLQAGVRGEVFNAAAGAKNTWTIDSPVDFLDVSNKRNSNNFSLNTCSHSRTDANILANTALSTLISDSPFGSESVFYEFKCLDAAQDTKARIRLVVRDWDRTFRINSGITGINSVNIFMNASGFDGFGILFNTKKDWDNPVPSSVPPAFCGDHTGYRHPEGTL